MAEGREVVDSHQSQETKNSVSQPFTLEAKVQRLSSQSKMLNMVVLFYPSFDQNNRLSKEVCGWTKMKSQNLTIEMSSIVLIKKIRKQ